MANPAATPVASNVVRLVVDIVTQSQRQQIVFDHLGNLTVPMSAADLTAFITAWDASCKVALLACLSPDSSLLSRTASEIHFGVTPTIVIPDAPATIGTAGVSNLPLEMAALMKKSTSLKGRHGLGRTYMPAIPNTFTTPGSDPNILNGTGTTAYTSLCSSLMSVYVVGAQSLSLCVATRPIPPASVIGFAVACIGMLPQSVLGTVRRRRPGRGI